MLVLIGDVSLIGTGPRTVRVLIRLATEMEMLDQRRYEYAARTLDDIGRRVGGWAKADAERPKAA
mgnify:FL=1